MRNLTIFNLFICLIFSVKCCGDPGSPVLICSVGDNRRPRAQEKGFFIAMNINPMMIMFYKQFAKEEQHALASYEGAITQTISGGSRRRVRNKMMLTFVDNFVSAGCSCLHYNEPNRQSEARAIHPGQMCGA